MQSSMRCRNACNQAWGVKMHATKYEVLKCMQLRIRCLNACNQAWSLGIYRTKQEVSKCMQPKGCYAWSRSVQLGQVVSALAMLDTRLIIESKLMEKIKKPQMKKFGRKVLSLGLNLHLHPLNPSFCILVWLIYLWSGRERLLIRYLGSYEMIINS